MMMIGDEHSNEEQSSHFTIKKVGDVILGAIVRETTEANNVVIEVATWTAAAF